MKLFVKNTFRVKCDSYGDFSLIKGDTFLVKVVGRKDDIVLNNKKQSWLMIKSEFLDMLRTDNVLLYNRAKQ